MSSASLFLLAACALAAVVPDERSTGLAVVIGLLVAYALVQCVQFEFAGFYVSPEQLLFVPIALLCPLPWVALIVAGASALSIVPDAVQGAWHRDRWIARVADSWFCVGPVLVLALLAPGEPMLEHTWVYALALAAQFTCDLVWGLLRNELIDRIPARSFLGEWRGAARLDPILSPVALMCTIVAVEEPVALLSIAPLVWILVVFARDRQARYAGTLELNRAYRGTVELLTDVVEFESPYVAAHSRSIVDLAAATAENLGVPHDERQRIEFTALLHDIGKIAIPKEVLEKPARLTHDEFALLKTHTIEGQFMLDRVGGLLAEIGEIVRSSHERWDGTGYPDGLVGEEIPLAARIVFACDAYHAMTSDRVYRVAMTSQDAITELKRNAGSQFDPAVVTALVDVVKEGGPVVVTNDELRAILAANSLTGHVERAV